MILDSKEQKQLLLDLVNSSTVPGSAIEQIYLLKQAILGAKIESNVDTDLSNLK